MLVFISMSTTLATAQGLRKSIHSSCLADTLIAMDFFGVALFWLLASRDYGLFLPSPYVHKVTLASWLLVIALNALLTLLFVTRILRMRKAFIRNLGKAVGKIYVNVVSIIVESFVL